MKYLLITLLILSVGCGQKVETIHPQKENISQSVFSTGIVKSVSQYDVYSRVNSTIEEVYVKEGDTVVKGQVLFKLFNENSKLNRENAELSAYYLDFNNNLSKLRELELNLEYAKDKMINDSVLYIKYRDLYESKIASKAEYDVKELNYKNSLTTYQNAKIRYLDTKKQIDFSSLQSKKNLLITKKIEDEYYVKSEIDGIVYSLNKKKGEMVSTQAPIATLGDINNFEIELQIDEYDIVKLAVGNKIILSMDSYKDKSFTAVLSRINPIMNLKTKTFTAYALFDKLPNKLYPNLSVESNILISEKTNAITLPREYLLNNNYVIKSNGDTVEVKIGLTDFTKVEILSGLDISDEVIKPTK